MKNFCLEKGKERLVQLDVKTFEKWYYKKLIYHVEFPNLPYWKTLPNKDLGDIHIPLNKVIGTGHIDYSDRTWLENLGCLKRFSPFYSREYCSSYFDSDEKKNRIELC